MTLRISIPLLLLMQALFLWSCRCPPCDPCQDDLLVTVPAEDATPPAGQWSFSQEVSHADGTLSSSISLVDDPSVPISLMLVPNTRTTIHFEASDAESGVKCLWLDGGFSFTCVQTRGPAITGHGMLPTHSTCPGLTTCGMQRLTLRQEHLEQYLTGCTPPYSFSQGEFSIRAISENLLGVRDTQTLVVQFGPFTL